MTDTDCQEKLKAFATELKHFIASLHGCAELLKIESSNSEAVNGIADIVRGNSEGLAGLQQLILDDIDGDYIP